MESNPGLAARTQEEFLLGFTTKLLTVDVKPDSFIKGLLRLTRQILEEDAPPEGKSGYRECQAVEDLADMTMPDR